MNMMLENLTPLLIAILSFGIITAWKFHKNFLTYGLWGAAIIIALLQGFITPLGITILLVEAGLIYAFYATWYSPFLKAILGGVITLIGMGLYLHWVPGFHNPLLMQDVVFSSDSYPYRFYLNIDKISIGLFFLSFGILLSRTFKEWKQSFYDSIGPLILAIIILSVAGTSLNYVRFDPKIPSLAIYWCLFNLLFVVVIEEAFFRGFLQHQLGLAFKNISQGKTLSIIIASLLYGIVHYRGGPAYIVLSIIAGCLYGHAYVRHNRLEAAIITHFGLNLVHFFLFSYPALAK